MSQKRGFTIPEILIAVTISSILIGLTAASYVSIQKVVGRNENEYVIAQNARAVVDRISRDVRQAVSFATNVPESQSEAISAIEIEDGHDVDPAGPTYITYELVINSNDGGFVKGVVWHKRYFYYNTVNPSIHLPYSSGVVGQGGFNRQDLTGESYIIAENVTDLNFYGLASLLQIDVTLQMSANEKAQTFHSAVGKRN